MVRDIKEARERLIDYRSTLVQDAIVDERSGLTVTDLDTIIAHTRALEHIAEAVEHSLDA